MVRLIKFLSGIMSPRGRGAEMEVESFIPVRWPSPGDPPHKAVPLVNDGKCSYYNARQLSLRDGRCLVSSLNMETNPVLSAYTDGCPAW